MSITHGLIICPPLPSRPSLDQSTRPCSVASMRLVRLDLVSSGITLGLGLAQRATPSNLRTSVVELAPSNARFGWLSQKLARAWPTWTAVWADVCQDRPGCDQIESDFDRCWLRQNMGRCRPHLGRVQSNSGRFQSPHEGLTQKTLCSARRQPMRGDIDKSTMPFVCFWSAGADFRWPQEPHPPASSEGKERTASLKPHSGSSKLH